MITPHTQKKTKEPAENKTDQGKTQPAPQIAQEQGPKRRHQFSQEVPKTQRPNMKRPDPSTLRTLSRDPNTAMQEMMETIDHLRDVYQRESEALRNGDVESFMSVQEEKLATAYQYQSDIQDLMDRGETLKEQGRKELIQELQAKYEEFTKATQHNVTALERMDRIMGRIGERLISAAKRAAMQDSCSYSASGAIQGKARDVVTTGVIETA